MKECPWQRKREKERRAVWSGEGRREVGRKQSREYHSQVRSGDDGVLWEAFRVPVSLYISSTLCLNVAQWLLLFLP